jgi:tetratricopeptide (TPR) repeat protein
MLRDFSTRYPESSLKSDAAFYLGVAYRTAHKPNDALTTFDLFLELSPKHDLASYAHLERARVLMMLKRPADAAEASDRAAGRFKKGRLYDLAVAQRAEALLAAGDYKRARDDYRMLGARALTDEERFNALLKEADCLEAGRDYDEEISLLQRSLAHEIAPQVADTSRRNTMGVPLNAVATGERWGRLTMRVGTVRALQGRKDEALTAYRQVIDRFQRQQLAAEAQYRIGYVYETVADDFETARTEYAKVRVQSATSVFSQQANQRAQNLERLSQFRASAGDTRDQARRGGIPARRAVPVPARQAGSRIQRVRQHRARGPGHPVGRQGAQRAGVDAADQISETRARRFSAVDGDPRLSRDRGPARRARLSRSGRTSGARFADQAAGRPGAPIDTTTALTPPPVTTPALGGAVLSDFARRPRHGQRLMMWQPRPARRSAPVSRRPTACAHRPARDTLRPGAPPMTPPVPPIPTVRDTVHTPAHPDSCAPMTTAAAGARRRRALAAGDRRGRASTRTPAAAIAGSISRCLPASPVPEPGQFVQLLLEAPSRCCCRGR